MAHDLVHRTGPAAAGDERDLRKIRPEAAGGEGVASSEERVASSEERVGRSRRSISLAFAELLDLPPPFHEPLPIYSLLATRYSLLATNIPHGHQPARPG